MVVGVILDDHGQPVCSEMWPGNTTDVTTLVPVIKRLRSRFGIGRICIVSDRGMISAKTIAYLEEEKISYILGARMRRCKEVKDQVLSCGGRYREVHPEGSSAKDPSPLKVKEVTLLGGHRYIVCLNEKQARKDAADRQAIIDSLEEKLKTDPKSLVGNKGYRKYLKMEKETVSVNKAKVEEEARYDGKWVLKTNTTLTAEQAALKYKELWQVGASSQGRIIQSVKVRPRLKDSGPRSLEGAVARKQDGEALRQHSLKGGCATHQVVTCSERRRSLVTRIPVAETVYNARRQQEMTGMSHIRHFSPAGYQRRHGAKDHAETGEALDARRRNLDEEFRPITLNGKWQEWRQGDGSGCSTFDLRAAKRAGREGPGPVVIPFGKVRQG